MLQCVCSHFEGALSWPLSLLVSLSCSLSLSHLRSSPSLLASLSTSHLTHFCCYLFLLQCNLMGFSGDKFNFDYLLHLCTCHTESCTDSVACAAAAAAACCGVRRLPGQRSHWSSSSRRCFIICKSVEIDLAALQSGTTQWGLL